MLLNKQYLYAIFAVFSGIFSAENQSLDIDIIRNEGKLRHIETSEHKMYIERQEKEQVFAIFSKKENKYWTITKDLIPTYFQNLKDGEEKMITKRLAKYFLRSKIVLTWQKNNLLNLK